MRPGLLISLIAITTSAALAASIPDEDWGYVDVRKGAHMFWWLYGATEGRVREETPLIMWLQGGPGGSSTGFGNFLEIGPLDVNLNARNTTWVDRANLLFVDNPVGTGFSYVDDASLFTTNNDQIARDLVSLITAFVQKYPVFSKTPFYVFCESYGGKMTTGFAQALLAAIKKGSVNMNFKGIALGDSWISAIDYVDTWGPFLQATSLLDAHQLSQVTDVAKKCDAAVAAGQWTEATGIWGNVENIITTMTDDVSFYNILVHHDDGNEVSAPHLASMPRHVRALHAQSLSSLMNGPIRQKLKIIPNNVVWGGQAGDVFQYLSGDFMKPVWDGVDALLQSGFNVTVYNGQLDLICCTPGTERWMQRMSWSGMPAFNQSPKMPLYPYDGHTDTQAFVKQYGALTMYYILNAGHMVPADNGPMAHKMMERVLAGL